MKRLPLTLLVLAVLVVGGRFIYGIVNHPDDKVQIQAALADAVKASREGRPGSVVDKLADNIKLNGAEQSIRQIADVVKNSRPDVTIKDNDPVVSGDTAQITSDVTVKADFMGTSRVGTFKDAQLVFKKEQATEWIIFPTTKWVLSDVRVAPGELPEIN